MYEFRGINALLSEKEEAARVEIAQKLADALEVDRITEWRIAGALILAHALATDAVERVRAALAESVRSCRFLPKETAFIIAQDIDAVACPFLSVTEIFSDHEWHELCAKLSQNALRSVAGREKLTEQLALSVTDFGDSAVANTLVENNAAPMTHKVCQRLISKFGHDASVMEKLAFRNDLIAEIAAEVTLRVSQRALGKLWDTYDLKDHISLIHGQAEIAALIRLIKDTPPRNYQSLVQAFQKQGKLSDFLLLSALCENLVYFFEVGVATRARKDLALVRSIIQHAREESIFSLFNSAKIFHGLQDQMRNALRDKV